MDRVVGGPLEIVPPGDRGLGRRLAGDRPGAA
jgi:hypothetical protein